MSTGTRESRALGKRIEALRNDQRGWDKATLARKAGVSASYIGRLERGEIPAPSLQRLAAISTALGVRVSDLTDPPSDLPSDLLEEVREACAGHEELLRQLLADVRRYPPEQRADVLAFGIQAVRLRLATDRPEAAPTR